MIPKDFPQSNFVFTKPAGATDEQCGNLPSFNGLERIDNSTIWYVNISAWQLSPEELEQIQKTGTVWLRMFKPPPVCPVGLSVSNPFEDGSHILGTPEKQ